MASIISELENEGLVIPDFGRSNLEIARQLGQWKGEFVGDREKKVFLIIDGFGYNILEQLIKANKIPSELLKGSQINKVTSLFPTTTINVLSSLYSGLAPSGHCVIGDNLLVNEIGSIVQVFSWAPASNPHGSNAFANINPNIIVPKPALLNKINEEHEAVFLHETQFVQTKATRELVGEIEISPFISLEDMLVRITKAMEGGKDCIIAYYDVADRLQHRYGPGSPEVLHLIHSMLQSLDRILLPLLRKNNYNLIITADHGQIGPISDPLVADHESPIMEYLTMPPWGQRRAQFISVLPSKEKAFEAFFDARYSKDALLLDSDEVINAGLFGDKNVSKLKRARFGTHIILPKGKKIFEYRFPTPDRSSSVIGNHGGLSEDEMYVPAILY